MAVVDLLEEQDPLIAHQYEFYLWPKLWSQYALPDPLKWEIHPFQANQECT